MLMSYTKKIIQQLFVATVLATNIFYIFYLPIYYYY